MGLDVKAFRKVERVADWPADAGSMDDIAEYDFNASAYIWQGMAVTDISPAYDRHIPARRRALTSGLYRYAGKLNGYSGSYSGYNDWRNWLAQARYGMADREVWTRCERDPAFEDGAALLINFSDCEGFIDAPTATRILADLRAHEEDILRQARSEYDAERFRQWMTMLEMAADGGMLEFC